MLHFQLLFLLAVGAALRHSCGAKAEQHNGASNVTVTPAITVEQPGSNTTELLSNRTARLLLASEIPTQQSFLSNDTDKNAKLNDTTDFIEVSDTTHTVQAGTSSNITRARNNNSSTAEILLDDDWSAMPASHWFDPPPPQRAPVRLSPPHRRKPEEERQMFPDMPWFTGSNNLPPFLSNMGPPPIRPPPGNMMFDGRGNSLPLIDRSDMPPVDVNYQRLSSYVNYAPPQQSRPNSNSFSVGTKFQAADVPQPLPSKSGFYGANFPNSRLPGNMFAAAPPPPARQPQVNIDYRRLIPDLYRYVSRTVIIMQSS